MFCQQLVATLLFSSMLVVLANADGHAHSFQHFLGPVQGDDREVVWTDKQGLKHRDYIAQPRYEFAYGVEDHHTGDYHGQKEYRDGKIKFSCYNLEIKQKNLNIRSVRNDVAMTLSDTFSRGVSLSRV